MQRESDRNYIDAIPTPLPRPLCKTIHSSTIFVLCSVEQVVHDSTMTDIPLALFL